MLWNTLTPPWQAAFTLAWEGYCRGAIPIGAAVADAEGRVIATGRNRARETTALPRQVSNSRLAHAEVNALLALDPFSEVDAHTCTLYTTTEPCPLCCGAAVMANIRHVAFASRDPWAGGAEEFFQATPYLRAKQMRVTPPQNPAFETLLIAMQSEFFLREKGSTNALIEAYRKINPRALTLASLWLADGTLTHLAGHQSTAEQVIIELENCLLI